MCSFPCFRFFFLVLFGIAAKKLRRGFPTSVGRAFALLMLRLGGFFSLPISLSRRIRDCGASGYEGGGFVPKSLPDVVGGCG